jgi:uncharacterized protein
MEKISDWLRKLSGETSLTYDPEGMLDAAMRGSVREVRSLIENGADINYKNEENATALIAASVKGHPKIVNMLLEREADVNVMTVE